MNLAVRYNQDNQRDFEERAALQMIALLTKRTSAEKNNHTKLNKQSHGCSNQPLGMLMNNQDLKLNYSSIITFK